MGEWLKDILAEMDESKNEDVRTYALRIRLSLGYLLEDIQDKLHQQTDLVATPWKETDNE